MGLLTIDCVEKIFDATKNGEVHWDGNIENELFSAEYNGSYLAIKYATKYYPVDAPTLMMGINIVEGDDKDKSELLNLTNSDDLLWNPIYSLWMLIVHLSTVK